MSVVVSDKTIRIGIIMLSIILILTILCVTLIFIYKIKRNNDGMDKYIDRLPQRNVEEKTYENIKNEHNKKKESLLGTGEKERTALIKRIWNYIRKRK